MAAPNYQAAGAILTQTIGSTITPSNPTHQTDDILIALCHDYTAGAGVSISGPSGWTVMYNGSISSSEVACYWRRATSGAMGNPTFSFGLGNNESAAAQVFSLRGCIGSGDWFEDSTQNSFTNDATPNTSSVDSTGPDRLCIAIVNLEYGGSYTGHPPSGWTSDLNNASSLAGPAIRFTVMSQTVASAGNVPSAVVGTQGTAAEGIVVTTFALPPPTTTITAVPAAALGDAPLPSPSLSVTIARAIARKGTTVPVPSLSVTAQAIARKGTMVPGHELALTTAAARAVGDVALPVLSQAQAHPYANVFIGSAS